MSEAISNYDNRDVEAFTHELSKAIFDLNKKHNDVLYRTNLGNSITEFIRFINRVKKHGEDKMSIKDPEIDISRSRGIIE